MILSTHRKRVNALLARHSAAGERCRTERDALRTLQGRTLALQDATRLTQAVAAQVQSRAHQSIAEVVTRCLAIFDEPYTFKIVFERKRSRTEARLMFERDGLEVDPLSAAGGGVVDVAAFALRVACLLLARPKLRRVLVLDEPFRFVSSQYRGRVRALLLSLARDLGVQLIMVTHDPALRAGRVTAL